MRANYIQIVPHSLGLFITRHVGYVPHSIERAFRVRIEPSEQRVEVVRRWTGFSDKLERLARGLLGAEAVDQCDLAARYDPVAGIAGVPPVALQKDEPVRCWSGALQLSASKPNL
jgi:hypothetical protein